MLSLFLCVVISKPYRCHISATPPPDVFVFCPAVLSKDCVIFITQIQRIVIIQRIYVAQITAAALLSTSKWKTTRYKQLTANVSFIPETLTG